MSTAMRSTLQTVPESLEVTKTSTTTQDVPVTASTKTPAKASGEAVATKSSRSYNYPSSTNKPITIKNQMMRLLRRSKSTATAQTEKTTAKSPPGHHQTHHHYHHNHVVHPQHNRNGGMVVNMVEGVPLVVGGGIGGKSKKLNQKNQKRQLKDMTETNYLKKFSDLNRTMNLQNRITRINYEPKFYVFDEAVGLFINWRVSDVYIISKISNGPVPIQCQENGETRTMLRCRVVTWPEMKYEPTPDILAFLKTCETNGTLHANVHMTFPSLEEFKNMENNAAMLHYSRKIEQGTESTHTIFEVDDIKLKPSSKITNIFSKLRTKTSTQYKTAIGEHCGHRAARPKEIEEVRMCTKVIQREEHGLYMSKHCPWLLFDADVKKPFWKLMYKAMGYQKLTVISMTCHLDIQAYLKVKNLREVRFLDAQERIRVSMLNDVRGI